MSGLSLPIVFATGFVPMESISLHIPYLGDDAYCACPHETVLALRIGHPQRLVSVLAGISTAKSHPEDFQRRFALPARISVAQRFV